MNSTASPQEAAQNHEMSFWEHLDMLRGVIVKMIVAVVVLTMMYVAVMPWIFDPVVLGPCSDNFILYRLLRAVHLPAVLMPEAYVDSFEVKLINIQLARQFVTHFSTSFYFAVVTAFPLLLYWMWQFVAPGLYASERRSLSRALIGGAAMFYLGVAVGYFIVFPLTLRFLAGYQLSDSIPNQISLTSYIDNFVMLIFVMGIVFELPMAAWLAGRLGLLDRGFFSRYRRHAIVALLVLAAVITPTGDPFTLLVVFLPIYMLWEMSALFVPVKNKQSTDTKTIE